MVERFQMKTEHDWICARLDEKGDWVRHSDYAALEAQLAEKDVENERLRNMLDGYGRLDAEAAIAEREAEALSRTGAVKVNYDALIQVLLDLQHEGMCRDRDIEPIADRILSALEPAAPEGQQPVAYRVHAPADEHYGIGPDRLQFHPLAQYDLDNGYRQTPLYTRPSEQAVTEAGERAAEQVMTAHYERPLKAWELTALHAALKAAMEAGRHE